MYKYLKSSLFFSFLHHKLLLSFPKTLDSGRMCVRLRAPKISIGHWYGAGAPLKTSMTIPCPLPASTKRRKMLAMFSVDFQNAPSTVVWKKGGVKVSTTLPKNPECSRFAPWSPASLLPVRTGWGVYKLLFRSSVSSVIHLKTLSYLPKTLSRILHGVFVGRTEKSIRHKDDAALRWGLQQRIMMEKPKRISEDQTCCVLLSKIQDITIMVESEWDLRRSFLLQNIH